MKTPAWSVFLIKLQTSNLQSATLIKKEASALAGALS